MYIVAIADICVWRASFYCTICLMTAFVEGDFPKAVTSNMCNRIASSTVRPSFVLSRTSTSSGNIIKLHLHALRVSSPHSSLSVLLSGAGPS